jgi:hypothetical protein
LFATSAIRHFGAGSASKVGRFAGRAIIFLFDATPSSRQIKRAGTFPQRPRTPMKSDTRKTLFSFLAELAIYSVLVVIYFFLVLHFLADWLFHLFEGNIKLYALVSIGLILGQAILLEMVTTFLFRLLRGRSE